MTGIDQILDAGAKPDEVKTQVKNLCKRAQKADNLKIKVKKLIETNRALNAKKNKIKAVTAKDKPQGRKTRGRPKGTKATKNYRPKNIDREELVDDTVCPDCGGELAKTISETCDKVVTHVKVVTENVRYVRTRRWCCICEKQVMQPIPGVKKYARRSSNHSATMTLLNMQGMSHAKTSDISKNIFKTDISRQTAYRDKISHSKELSPLHDCIKEKILKKDFLRTDEFHQTTQGGRGFGLIALADDCCLVEISEDRKIITLKKFLPGYKGKLLHDSLAVWFHIGDILGGQPHQMCLAHQIRLPKKDIKYQDPNGDVKEFLEELIWIIRRYYDAHQIEDLHTRRVAAACIDHQMSDLMNTEFKDNKTGIIKKFRKRYRREGHFLSTFLKLPGIGPDNNPIERMNRIFVCIRSDGGGNRSIAGMKASSILYTVYATCKINGENFFELVSNTSGDG